MKKSISILSIFVLLVSMLIVAPVQTNAIAMTIIATPTSGAVSTTTATDVMLSWTIGTQNSQPSIATGSTVVLKIRDGLGAVIGTTPTSCTGASSTSAIAGGGVATSSSAGTLTFTFATTTSGTAANACIKVPAGLAVGAYAITMTSGSPAFDSGAVAIYAGNMNIINVTADVDPQFSFNLGSNSCNLGVLTTAASSTCYYDATSTSNSAQTNAITIKAQASNPSATPGALATAGGTNTINPQAAAGNPVAGTAFNGIRLANLSNFAAQGTYSTATILGFDGTAQNILQSTTGAGGSFRIFHHAGASNSTAVGHYTQTVTWTATLSF